MSAQFISTIKARRTIYGLEAKSPIADSKIQEIVEQCILHVPSSFNSQSTRVVLLLKGEHEKLWDITKEVLQGVVPAEQFEGAAKKIGGFKAGYGTVSFFLLVAFNSWGFHLDVGSAVPDLWFMSVVELRNFE